MKNKRRRRMAFIAALAVAAVGSFPAGVSAVTGSEVAADGSYTADSHVEAHKETNDESADTYDVRVTLTVKDGLFSDVKVVPGQYDVLSEPFISSAKDALVSDLWKRPATEDTIEKFEEKVVDARTHATASRRALKQASLAAIHSAPKAGAPEGTPGASPMPTAAPSPTAAPDPTKTPEPSASPIPTATPDATVTPDVTVTPLPDNTGREEFRSGRPKFSAALSGDGKSVTITWSAYPGADSYEVRRRTVGKGGFAAIGTAGKNVLSYTDYKVEPGTTYNYSVVAVSKEWGESDYDRSIKVAIPAYPASETEKPAEVKAPAKTTLKSVTAKKKQAVLKWKKPARAEGYEICRATKKNGSYAVVKTIKKASTLTYTDKKLTSKKTYYYKIRAYLTADGEKICGAYSAAKKVKIK